MDIISAIGDCRLYTLHSHTQFCDGRDEMEEFVKIASKIGFKHYGFTPHSPIPLASPCNMAKEDVPAYFEEVKRLQSLYPDIKLYTGMEVDYLGSHWGPTSEYFLNLGLDYVIGSVHFIPNQEGRYIDIDGKYENFKKNMEVNFHNDIRYVVETFFRHSMEMVETGGFDIIGHLDKIKQNAGLFMPGLEDETWYGNLVNELIDAVIDKKYIVEINTKAWKEHQQLFPSQRHWKRLLQAGVPIVVNSDAHYPSLINASRKETFAALDYLRKQCL